MRGARRRTRLVRRLSTLLVLAAGAGAAVVFWRGRQEARRPHVDLYYEDGSMISLTPDSSEWERLQTLARGVLAAARG